MKKREGAYSLLENVKQVFFQIGNLILVVVMVTGLLVKRGYQKIKRLFGAPPPDNSSII